MERRKFHSIDICKLLMAFCVVGIHTHPLEHCTVDIINDIYESFVSIAVPFFFLASGFLLAQKFEYPLSSFQNINIIKRHLLKIIKMYFFWTIIYLPMAIYYFISTGNTIFKSILIYIRGFIFIGEQYNSWHLWYLLSTIYALIFILILLYLKQSPKKIIAVSGIIFLISIIIDYLSGYNGNSNVFLQFLIKMIKVSIGSGRILKGFFYIPLGIMLAKKQSNVKVSWLMFIGGYTLNVFVKNSYLDSILIAISSIGLFCVVKSFTLRNSNIYPFIREMSTVIYFIHMYVWSIYYMLVYGEKTYGLDCFLITLGICLIVAIISVAITNKYKNNNKN